jgi:Flp pilus assembly protein TadG
MAEQRRHDPLGFRRDTAGATAIEFAIVSPILIALVMGAVEFSLILFTYTSAGAAARDVARRVATSRLAASSATSAINAQMPPWVQSSTSVTVNQTAPSDPSTNQISVVVSFPARNATPTNLMMFAYQSLNLSTSVTMQQEN